jgi:hypothetical protein
VVLIGDAQQLGQPMHVSELAQWQGCASKIFEEWTEQERPKIHCFP